ncbi:MAG: WD40/YVTN/BNR-like repeat-containing protein [Phycisphaerales bacterium]
MTNRDNRIILATRKGLFFGSRSGPGTWQITQRHFFGDNCSLAMSDPRDGAIYAALDHGHFGAKLHRSDDDGATWKEIAAPVYPPVPEGYQPKPNPMSGRPIPWSLKMIWALEPGSANQPGRLWCGTLPGGLFRSDDRGASWSIMRSLWDKPERETWFGGGYDEAGIHSICVDPRNDKHVYVAVSCGGAWLSEDDGNTWNIRAKGMRADFMPPEQQFDENSQDPHCMVRCPAAPDVLWVQHHNGIFRTVDNGKTWTELNNVQPSSFGFAVAVHPDDPETAWFVPAIKDEKRVPVDGKLVVTRTRDGGKSFDIISKGLPQENACDLIFRHALDVDATGKVLAFGSTTGSLWISDDGGDSWQVVSQHLPPIHAVRFG